MGWKPYWIDWFACWLVDWFFLVIGHGVNLEFLALTAIEPVTTHAEIIDIDK